MSKKPETILYQRLKENLPKSLITRIESRVNLGIPDCFIALKQTGRIVPVELKVVTRGKKISLSPHQIAFHAKHAEIGVRTFVIVLHSPIKAVLNDQRLFLFAGQQIFDLARSGLNTSPVAVYDYDSVPWSVLMHALAEG